MKKLFTTLTLFTAMAGTSFAGGPNIIVKDINGTQMLNGQTVTVNGSSTEFDIHEDLMVINNTAASVVINCKRYETSVVPNTINYFCWFVCLPTSVYAESYPLWTHPQGACGPIAAGDTVTSFAAHLKPEGLAGVNSFRYVWFNTANPNDSVYVDIVFDIAMNVDEQVKPTEVNVYPNPAKDLVTVSFDAAFNANRSIVLYDLLGSKVAEYAVNGNNGKMTFDVSALKNGVYLYSMTENGKAILTRRLVVAK